MHKVKIIQQSCLIKFQYRSLQDNLKWSYLHSVDKIDSAFFCGLALIDVRYHNERTYGVWYCQKKKKEHVSSQGRKISYQILFETLLFDEYITEMTIKKDVLEVPSTALCSSSFILKHANNQRKEGYLIPFVPKYLYLLNDNYIQTFKNPMLFPL